MCEGLLYRPTSFTGTRPSKSVGRSTRWNSIDLFLWVAAVPKGWMNEIVYDIVFVSTTYEII